jgi:hypothetical protein
MYGFMLQLRDRMIDYNSVLAKACWRRSFYCSLILRTVCPFSSPKRVPLSLLNPSVAILPYRTFTSDLPDAIRFRGHLPKRKLFRQIFSAIQNFKWFAFFVKHFQGPKNWKKKTGDGLTEFLFCQKSFLR